MHDVAWYRDNNAARNDISLPIVEHEWYFKSPSGDIWHGSNSTHEKSGMGGHASMSIAVTSMGTMTGAVKSNKSIC
jgi:hypothetical protein